MTTTILTSLSALLLFMPAAGNAQTIAAPPARNGASQPSAPSAAIPRSPGTGVTLQRFEARHERKLMALDTDGDGRISRAEFLAGARAGKRDPAARFAKLDRNGDGFIDKGEIDAQLARRFHRLDTNGDGVLSVEERTAAKHRQQGASVTQGAATGDAQP